MLLQLFQSRFQGKGSEEFIPALQKYPQQTNHVLTPSSEDHPPALSFQHGAGYG
jgi:hypothetical protein